MPRKVTILRVFLASPDQLAEERNFAQYVVDELNRTWLDQENLRLELVTCETHSFPDVGPDPQAVINRQIADDYDIFVGILWSNFGTRTARAGSGTEEEFDRAYKRYLADPKNVHIMFYFKSAPMPPLELDPKQLAEIRAFRGQLGEKGVLWWSFESADDFKDLLRIHLTGQVRAIKKTLLVANDESDESQVGSAGGPRAETSEVELHRAGEDEGLLDLVSIVDEGMDTSRNSLDRITRAISELSESIARHTNDLDAANVSGGTSNDQARRLLNRVADDIADVVSRMKPELPIFADNFRISIDAVAKTATVLGDFPLSESDKTDLRELVQTLVNASTTTAGSRKDVREFRDAVLRLPRLTTRLNRSKRELGRFLDQFDKEMGSCSSLLNEAVRLLRRTLEDQGDGSQQST